MKISTDEIKHVAKLARLQLDDSEVDSMAGQLDKILGYVDKLGELDTEGIKPTTHALSISNAFREDSVVESIPQDKALENCAEHNDEAFIVPRII